MSLLIIVRGFDNKVIRQLLYVSEPVSILHDNYEFGYQSYRSMSQLNETFQFTLNGIKYVSFNGVDTPTYLFPFSNVLAFDISENRTMMHTHREHSLAVRRFVHRIPYSYQ